MKTIELNVERREETGKNEARRSRARGRIPAVVYGAGKPTVPIALDRKALTDAFRKGAGENAIFLLKLAGSDQTRHAMIRELARDPVSREPLHIDFVRVLMDTKIRVKVPIEVVGLAKGVKSEGGILDFVTREVEIECLPGNIPAHLPIDVSELGIGDALRIASLPPVEGVTVVDDPEKVLVHVTHPTQEKEPEVAAAEAAAEPTEPEVLKKGKVATEEEAPEPEKVEKKEKKEKEK
ncbi:MAG TPA: 50S ribosomal protein L25 [Thermoanaerobaculia bacterium]|nr:50S ribosomal protein L25 [Thermoanaerobaculia bacterium]